MTASTRNLFRPAALAHYANAVAHGTNVDPTKRTSVWAGIRLLLALVGRVLLTPFTLWRRRVPIVLQMSTTECGAACLAMVLGYYGRAVALSEVSEEMGIGRDGATALAIANAARRYGLAAKAFRGEPHMLADVTLPVILHWNFTHYVVLESWSDKGAVIVDPGSGRCVVSPEDFDRFFTGVLLTLQPDATFVRQRRTNNGSIWREQIRSILMERGSWRSLLAVLGATLLVQVLALTLPWLTQYLVDQVLPQRQVNLVPLLAAGIGIIVLMQMVIGFVRQTLLIRVQAAVDTSLMSTFLSRLLALPYRFFQQRTSGDLLMRLSSNIVIRDLLTTQTIGAVMDGLLVITFLTVLLLHAPVYGMVTLGIGVFQVLLLLASTARMHDLAQRHLTTQAESQSYLVEALAGVDLVKATGAEEQVIERWSKLHHKALGVSLDKQQFSALIQTLLNGLQVAAPLVLLLLGVQQVMNGELSLGEMLALNALAIGFLAPLDTLVGSAQQLQTVGAHLTRLADVLGAEPEPSGTVQPELSGQIELVDVSFQYDRYSPPILRDVSVTIEPGQKVAIVGQSGSGKSTLARLLLGLHEPTAGDIRFDGTSLVQMDRQALRQQIGSVPQEVFLFSGSIRQNIAFGLGECSLDDLLQVTRMACIDEDIVNMPMGFDTMVAEGGAGLSGGQRQRLALARALAHKPAILVMDEATSHLDTTTERKIQENLIELGCTQVIIAHRLSTIQSADLILVMDGGRIVERGTHAELLTRNGLYAALCQSGQSASAE